MADTRANDRVAGNTLWRWCWRTLRCVQCRLADRLHVRDVMLGVPGDGTRLDDRVPRETIEPGNCQVRLRDLGMEGISSEGASAA